MRAPGSRSAIAATILGLLLLSSCEERASAPSQAELAALSWEGIVERARGSRVLWRMWRGDPSINAYVDEWLAPGLRERYQIELIAVEGQGAELVNQLLVERDAGAQGGADLVWINGQTFQKLRADGLLYGPWAGRLPNARLIDSSSTIITRDFEQDPAGFESPWGRVQFALIYDTVRTPHPPRSVEELGAWIHAHPGRFTHDRSFTGTTFHKTLLYALNGGVERFQGGFDAGLYAAGSERVWDWLERHRPYFWRRGETFPPEVADLHRLFVNQEVDFSMSNNEHDVVTKIRQGIFPPTARPLLLRDGTIANAHYVGIPFNAPNPAGAMVVADFLLSPEAQLQKLRPEVWADGTVLDVRRLPGAWAQRFRDLQRDAAALPADSLRRYARPEVAAEYHVRLEEGWRARIRDSRD